MANISALGGLARGLASSPLGNLSGLLMQKEQLNHNRKMMAAEEQRMADAKIREQQEAEARARMQAQTSEFSALVAEGEMTPKEASLLSLASGDKDTANYFMKFGDTEADNQLDRDKFGHQQQMDKQKFGLSEREFDHEQSMDKKQLGLDERKQDYTEKQGERAMTIKEADANMRSTDFWTGKADEVRQKAAGTLHAELSGGDPQSATARINDNIKNNPKFQAALQEILELGDNRQLRGVELVVGENGQPYITASVYNKGTGTVGPATMNASAAPGDTVQAMPLEAFKNILAQEAGLRGGGSGAGAGAGGGGKWKKHNETTLFNDSTGEFKERNLSLSESQDMYYESGLENIDKTFPTTAGMMGGLPEGSGDKNRLAKVLFGGLRGYNGLRSGAEAAVIDLVGRNDQDVKDAMNGDGEATERLLKRLLPPQKVKDVEKNTKEQFKEVVGAPPKMMPRKPGSELRKFAGGYQPSPTDMIFNPSP